MSVFKRFDLGTKVCLAERFKYNRVSSSILNEYLRFIYIWNGLKEPNSTKSSKDDFINVFNSIVTSQIEKNEYDFPPIPINSQGVIQNGSHRLASSLVNNIIPKFISSNEQSNYDYKYFQTYQAARGRLSERMLAKMLYRNMSTSCSGAQAAIIFPKAFEKDNGDILHRQIQSQAQIVWDCTMQVSAQRLKYLILNSYPGENWLGLKQGARGLEAKFNQVRNNEENAVIRFIVFVSDENNDTIKLKSDARAEYKLGKDSLHISDGNSDTLSLVAAFSSILLNPSSIEKIKFSSNVLNALNDQHTIIGGMAKDKSRCMLVGSAPVEIFGGRNANDLDFISAGVTEPVNGLNDHNEYDFFFDASVLDVIDNLDNKIHFFGIPVADPTATLQFKKNRGEAKDFEDIDYLINLLN